MKTKSAILLAGGTGSRLMPFTSLYNKHMIPILNKFIIDYPINSIKNMGIENLTIVLGGPNFSQVVSYIKDGSDFGLNVNYIYQKEASGIAQAINICKKYTAEQFCVILGDNIFDSKITWEDFDGAQILIKKHTELKRFGVASIQDNKIVSIEEKPKVLNHNLDQYAITGCYMFDQKFFDYFTCIKPSKRNEYEITDIIDLYNQNSKLHYSIYNGFWNDAGTHESISLVTSHLNQSSI